MVFAGYPQAGHLPQFYLTARKLGRPEREASSGSIDKEERLLHDFVDFPSPWRTRTMLVVAHRGACKEALENSWAAFEAAVDSGADRIELDAQLTADGEVVVMHDDDLRRTAGSPLAVREMTAKRLRSLRLNNGEDVPFLVEVLDRMLPRIELNVEIKGAGAELARAVAMLVDKHSLRGRVVLSSFDLDSMELLGREFGHLRRALLLGADSFRGWCIAAAPQLAMERAVCQTVHPYAGDLDSNFMDQAAARGWTVIPYVGMVQEDDDREALWISLKSLGVHGLCTNYPRELRAWLRETAHDLPGRR